MDNIVENGNSTISICGQEELVLMQILRLLIIQFKKLLLNNINSSS